MAKPGDIFEFEPAPRYIDGNPFRALVRVSSDSEFWSVRITPPFVMYPDTIKDASKDRPDVTLGSDHETTTSSATTFDLIVLEHKLNVRNEETTEARLDQAMSNTVGNLLELLGRTENEELFKLGE